MSEYLEKVMADHIKKLDKITEGMRLAFSDRAPKPAEQEFFAKYGNEPVCITSWLAEPRFTVNELVAAIEAKIRSNK